MSTTVRSSPPTRSGRAKATSLTTRAVRVRNACLRHAAAAMGLPVPSDAELNALRPDASLATAVRWWESTHSKSDSSPVRARPPFLLRAACAATVTLLALAFSYGSLH